MTPSEIRTTLESTTSRGAVAPTPNPPDQSDVAEISLAPLWRFLRRYAPVVAVGVILLLLLQLGSLLQVASWTRRTFGSIGVRFTFAGVDKDRYPNDTPFSPQDLLARPILEEVYAVNELSSYLPFDGFASSLLISESNLPLASLQAEYDLKLNDLKLSVGERRTLEEEFKSRAAALHSSSYELSFTQRKGTALPAPVLEKILLDIPRAWADFSVEKRHVLAYDVPIVAVLPEGALGSSNVDQFLLAAELLRTAAKGLSNSVAKIQRLPGASLIRDSQGGTIDDLEGEIAAYSRAAVYPAYLDILQIAYRTAPQETESRLSSRLEGDRRAVELARSRVARAEQSFSRYAQPRLAQTEAAGEGDEVARGGASGTTALAPPRVIAQVSDGFLQQLIQSIEQGRDIAYRQELNDEVRKRETEAGEAEDRFRLSQGILEQVRAAAKSPQWTSPDDTAERVRQVLEALRGFSKRISESYNAISVRNLNPPSALYAINVPFRTMTVSAIGIGLAAAVTVSVVIFGTFLMYLLCAIYQAISRHSHDSSAR